jgi:autotransporter strand-loop-strand O-heptosyltransferase
LGDTLAWLPYCREFAKKYDCKVVVSTFKNFLFEKNYPDLEFVDRGVPVPNIIAQFNLGWFWNDKREPVNPILIPLQQTATNILNLPYTEIIPDIVYEPQERPIEEKYVCISIYSTSGLKLWYYWQDVIDWLKQRGYRVFEISKEEEMMGVKTADFNGLERISDTSLETTINYLVHSEYYIGLSSGISWLAWAYGVPVVMISNFTEDWNEFDLSLPDYIRITNKSVCHGCWNRVNIDHAFKADDWYWCPKHQNTERQFECHTTITPEMVFEKIKKWIN